MLGSFGFQVRTGLPEDREDGTNKGRKLARWDELGWKQREEKTTGVMRREQ